MSSPPAMKRSDAAREFAEIPRANRPLTASRWAPALPSFALAFAALAACGGKEDAGPERSAHVAVRAAEGAKSEGPPNGSPWRAGDEPGMAGLVTPVVSSATPTSSAASTAPIAVVATVAPTTISPTPPIRTAGARAPTVPTATATAIAPVPSIAPSHTPPVVKGKMASVHAAPIGASAPNPLDDGPSPGAAPCPNPKGGTSP